MPDSVMSVRVINGDNALEKSVTDGVYAFAHPKKHARIPPEVYGDPSLTDRDVRVYAVIAQFQKKGTPNSSVGMRLIGKIINAPLPRVCESVGRLARAGHILKAKVASGKRQQYELLSPIFRSVVAHVCAKCGKGGKLDKACHCKACVKTIHPKHFDAVAEQEKRKVDRLVSYPGKKTA